MKEFRGPKNQQGFLAGVAAAAVGGGITAGFGSLLDDDGGEGGSANYQQAVSELQRSVGDIQGVSEPTYDQLLLRLQQAVYVGDLSPIEAITYLQGQTELKGIAIDPRLELQQFESLVYLRDQVEQGGLNETDRASLFNIFSEQDRELRGKREATTQEFAERGLSGSGLELAERMIADQEGADRAAMEGINVAALAQQRRDAANLQAGELAGDIRTQQFGEQEAIASAQDAINKFNTQNQQAVELSNVENQRDVALHNITQQQKTSDLNTATANAAATYNVGIPQQQYDNALAKQKAIADIRTNMARVQSGQGAAADELQLAANKQQASVAGGIVQGLGQAVSDFSPKEALENKKALDELFGWGTSSPASGTTAFG